MISATQPQLTRSAPKPLEQEQAAKRMAAQTGMTLPFAVQCLAQNEWNYDLALANFNGLKATNSIPPEAFA